MRNAPQVLVVGAGPTGLVTAIELRRRHIDCRIIERRSGPSHTSRAITVHAHDGNSGRDGDCRTLLAR